MTNRHLLEEEEAAVEADPDDVHEVPVVAHTLEHRGLARITLRTLEAGEQEDHGGQPEEDVEPVDTGHDVEERPVRGMVGSVAGLWER